MTFKVPVERTDFFEGFMFVEAKDEKEAVKIANEKLSDHDDSPKIEWQKEPIGGNGVFVCNDAKITEVPFCYTNRYIHCGKPWCDAECDSMHNDKCPECNKEIEPYESIENPTGYVVDQIGTEEIEKRKEFIRELAREEIYSCSDGDIEIDDNAEVSEAEGGSNGAYVAAWIWASFAGSKLDNEFEPNMGDEPGLRVVGPKWKSCSKCGDTMFEGYVAFVDLNEGGKEVWLCTECNAMQTSQLKYLQ